MCNIPLLSVIIPAYNAESTLENAVMSVVSQGDERIEVIIVDDGSTDETRNIAETLAKHWRNISVFSIENSGVAYARNIAIKQSKGQWIIFVDADDEFKPGIYENLCELALHEDYDIIFGMKEYVTPDKTRFFLHKELSSVGDGLTAISCVDVLRSLLSTSDDSLSGSCTRALYRRKWINDNEIEFPVGIKLGEDECYLIECIEALPKIARAGILFYRVNQNVLSITHGYIEDLENSIQYIIQCIKRVTAVFSEIQPLFELNLVQNIWILIDNSAKLSLSQAINTSKQVFLSDNVCTAIRTVIPTDLKTRNRLRILKSGLLFFWLPATVLRCKRYLEGYRK